MRYPVLSATTALALLAASAAEASETITYSYDARGRLIQVSHSGTVNDGIVSSYSYDRADNRTNATQGTGGGGLACSGASFSIASNGPVAEGTSSVFTVSKSGTVSSSCSIDYATANGTAAAGSDYTAKSGTLAFTSAQSSKTVSVLTSDDAAVESPETFSMGISNPTDGGAVGSPASATATLTDNDSSPVCSGVSFKISSNGAVTEGANSVFTVTKTGTATGSCGVSYATSNGTALAGSDYSAKSGSLTFTTAQTSQTISVLTTNDAATESAETFSMSLSAPTGGSTLGTPSSVTATINDNDGPVNHAPVANDDGATVGACKSVTVNVVANDTDADGDTLTVTGVSGGTKGTPAISGTTSVKYTAFAPSGSDLITYTVSDGHGGTDSGVLSIIISGGVCQ